VHFQIPTWPVVSLRQRMSDVPSPLKSPIPTTFVIDPRSTEVVPGQNFMCISQMPTWPANRYATEHRRSVPVSLDSDDL